MRLDIYRKLPSSWGRTDSTRLLRALRPMLSERRRQKLDQALKLLQFMRVLPLLKSSGLF